MAGIDAGTMRIGEAAAKTTRQPDEHRLVHNETIGSVRQACLPAGGTDCLLESDVRSDPREQETSARQHAPELTDHRVEVVLVLSKVQHRAAHHGMHALVGIRKLREIGNDEVRRGQLRRETRRCLANDIDCRRFAVHAVAVNAALQQIDQVAAIATASIEHALPTIESATQDLVEEIDVDVAELLPQSAAMGQHAKPNCSARLARPSVPERRDASASDPA